MSALDTNTTRTKLEAKRTLTVLETWLNKIIVGFRTTLGVVARETESNK